MNDCVNCGNGCLEETSDKCTLYTGPDFPKFGIKKGDYLDKVVVDLLNELQKICDTKVELKCLYTGECDNCESEVEIPKAVQVIIDKLCTLTSSDVRYEGERYCIGDTSISSGAVFLLGKNFKYSVEPAVNGTAVTYDVTEFTKNLPADYTVGRVTGVVSGKPERGKSIILDSNKSFVGATVSNDRFPVTLDLDVRVKTPSGDVKMVKTVSIPSPQSGTYFSSFNVQDFGAGLEEYNLESFTQALAAQVCANKTELEGFKNIDLPGCSHIEYNSTDIKDILAKHGAILCDILSRLDTLEEVEYTSCDDGCGEKVSNNSVSGAINDLSSRSCSMQSSIDEIRRSVQTLGDIQNTNSGSQGSGGIITNGKTTGGCIGGNCGGSTKP